MLRCKYVFVGQQIVSSDDMENICRSPQLCGNLCEGHRLGQEENMQINHREMGSPVANFIIVSQL
jgi:hypothetical protein